MTGTRGLYEVRKFRVKGDNGQPATAGVRVGAPKEPSAARNDLTWIARHHHTLGDTILSRLSPTELRVKLRSGGRVLYRVQGPLPR